MPSNVIAGCFAMAAFAVAIVAGLSGQNGASVVLVRALMALIFCYPVGLLVGIVCQRIIQDQTQTSAEDEAPQEAATETGSVDEPPGSQQDSADDEELITV